MPSSTFFSRGLYELLVTTFALTCVPLIVAVIAPLSAISRLFLFIWREFCLLISTIAFSTGGNNKNNIVVTNNNNNNNVSSFSSAAQSSPPSQSSRSRGATASSTVARRNPPGRQQQQQQQQPQQSFQDNNNNQNSHDRNIQNGSSSSSTISVTERDIVVIINATSSPEAEGLVRFYLKQFAHVIACDRNVALISEVFRDEPPYVLDRLHPVALLGPETAGRVRDAVAQLVSEQGSLTLFAVIVVEPSGETVLRRFMERESLIGNNRIVVSNSSSSSSSPSSSSSRSPSSASSSTGGSTTTELVKKLCEYLSGVSSSASSSSTNNYNNNDQNMQNQPPRRSSSTLSADSRSSSVNNNSSNNYASSASVSTLDQHISRSLQDAVIDASVFTPTRTITAVLRDLLPTMIRDSSYKKRKAKQKSQVSSLLNKVASVFTGATNSSSSSASDSSSSSSSSSSRSSSPALPNSPSSFSSPSSSSSSTSSSSVYRFSPARVVLVTRPEDEPEQLSTVLSWLHFQSSSSSSSASLQQLPQQIFTLPGVAAMRRASMKSILDFVNSSCSFSSSSSTSSSSSLFGENGGGNNLSASGEEGEQCELIRTVHLELFSSHLSSSGSSAQLQARRSWLASLSLFFDPQHHQLLQQQKENRSLHYWKVPRIPSFFAFSSSSSFDSVSPDRNQNSRESSAIKEEEEEEEKSKREGETSSAGTRAVKNTSSSTAANNPLTLDLIEALGEATCTIYPSSSFSRVNETNHSFIPSLQALDPEEVFTLLKKAKLQFEERQQQSTTTTATTTITTTTTTTGNYSNSVVHNYVVNFESSADCFVAPSFWTRSVGWSFREEKFLEAMVAQQFQHCATLQNVVMSVLKFVLY